MEQRLGWLAGLTLLAGWLWWLAWLVLAGLGCLGWLGWLLLAGLADFCCLVGVAAAGHTT